MLLRFCFTLVALLFLLGIFCLSLSCQHSWRQHTPRYVLFVDRCRVVFIIHASLSLSIHEKNTLLWPHSNQMTNATGVLDYSRRHLNVRHSACSRVWPSAWVVVCQAICDHTRLAVINPMASQTCRWLSEYSHRHSSTSLASPATALNSFLT